MKKLTKVYYICYKQDIVHHNSVVHIYSTCDTLEQCNQISLLPYGHFIMEGYEMKEVKQ
jgi:hypothetical protein